MIRTVEEQTAFSEIQYAMAVHRHTSKNQVHVSLSRDYTDKEIREKKMLHHLPKSLSTVIARQA
jgi:hypothetical protein